MPAELKFKLVYGMQDGTCVQEELSAENAENMMRKVIGEQFDGAVIGHDGWTFEITGGSDSAGFPMRRGIQQRRKRILTGTGVGFSGKKRNGTNQKGLLRRRTVCGDRIDITTRQINLKVVKAGETPLINEPAN